MQKRASPLPKSAEAIPAADLKTHVAMWLLDCEDGQLSARTIDSRKRLLDKLLWFLQEKEYEQCGLRELREFLAYVSTAHTEPEGRWGGKWGNERMRRKVRPSTVETYYRILATFFRFLVRDGIIDSSPMENIRKPIARTDQVQPFTHDQVNSLLQAAKGDKQGLRSLISRRRDEAIVLLLLDSGLRASEVCGLRRKDVNMDERSVSVIGKGNKRRMVYFSRHTAKAIWQYLLIAVPEPDEPLFAGERGSQPGDPLTPSGLFQLIRRLGRTAGLQTVRCSPHTFRHTFAVEFLRAGGNVFSLQTLLGHTSLNMSRRYAALAEADIQNQHRQFSPVERLKGKGK